MLTIRNLLAVALATSLLSFSVVASAQAPTPAPAPVPMPPPALGPTPLPPSALPPAPVPAPRAGGDEADVAATLARQIVEAIVNECPSRCRVAVFPFGDSQGRLSGPMAETAEILRGELINQLAKAAAGRMFILDRDGLAREFRSAGIDASGISPQDGQATARVLQKIGVDVAILGTMNPPSVPGGPTALQVFAIKQTGGVIRLSYEGLPTTVQPSPLPLPPSPQSASRFEVDVLVDGRPLAMQHSTNPDSSYFNALFLVLPRQMVGREYQIRLANRGTPPLASNASDARRLFGVVVTVDGVNTIYQENGRGQLGPVVLHPKNCLKWILSGPGQLLTPDPNSPVGYRAEPTSGPGNSVVTIPGFQNGPQFAKAFTFAMVRDSVAENIGITNDIGLIAVHIYPEDLPGDQPSVPVIDKSLGATRPGRDLANPVYKVRTRLKANPVEVGRIFYRYEDDPSLNQLALQPITD